MDTSNQSKTRKRTSGLDLLGNGALLLMLVYSILPLVVLVFNSFKSTEELAANPFGLPKVFHWSNYSESWRIGNFQVTLVNSVLLVALTVVGVLIVSFLAAYALSRFTPVGYDFFISFLLLGSIIPIQLYIIPVFIFLTRANLLDNLLVLSVIYIAKFAPFSAFLLRAFLLAIPTDFEDAARVDGASEFQMLSRIVFPVISPAVLTVALVTGLRVWNEFTMAVTLIFSEANKPVSTSLFAFQQKHATDWGLTNAGAVITVLPVIILFLLLQKRFIEGLTQGGVKG